MSTVEAKHIRYLRNLNMFYYRNSILLENKEPSFCRPDPAGLPQRGQLPCSQVDPETGELPKCEQCPYFSVENAQEANRQMTKIIQCAQMEEALKGNYIDPYTEDKINIPSNG